MSDGDPKQFFLAMAARIERNDAGEFGGAMLVVPPKGEPVEYLFITTKPEDEEPFFWAQCKSKLDETAVERLSAVNNNDPFAIRRR